MRTLMSLAVSLKVRRVAHVVGLIFPVVAVAQLQPAFRSNAKKPKPEVPTSGIARVVITGEEIRRRNVRSLDDLLRGEAPDVFATGPATSKTTTLRSRGLSSPSTWATPRVYLNGVELDAPGSLREIAPDIVDSIVVRPGVLAGAFDGVGADGGVIYIYTQRGSDSTRVTSSGKITGGKDRSLDDSKSRRFSDDIVAFSGGHEGTTYYVAGGTASEGAWAPGYRSNMRHGIGMLSSKGKYGVITGFYRYQRDAGTPDDQSPIFGTTTVDTGFRTDTALHTTYGGSADLVLAPFWTVHASGGLDRAEYGGSMQQMLVPLDSLHLGSHERVRRTSFDARTTLSFPAVQGVATSLTAGESQAITLNDSKMGSLLDTAVGVRSWSKQFRRGYFGALNFRYADLFVLNAGVRRDDKLGPIVPVDSKWRPRADAALMIPTPVGRVTMRGGAGYIVVPAVASLPIASGVAFPNGLVSLLSIRDLHATEAGADLAGSAAAVGVTVYDQRSTMGYGELPSMLGGPPLVLNFGSVRNRGVSAYARGNYGSWSARASYSTVQSREDSTLLLFTPLLQPSTLPQAYGHAALIYTGESIRLSYDADYMGSHHNADLVTYAAGGRTYPAFFLHDVNASLPFGKDAWIIAYAHNVMNAEEYDVNNGTYVRGRRLGFGVRFGNE